MALEYDLYRNPPRSGSNRPTKLHARVVTRGTKDTPELAKLIQSCCSVTVSDVKAVLSALSDVLVNELSHGHGIHLEGLGYFRLSLNCPPIDDPQEVRGTSIHVKDIDFRADAEFRERFQQIEMVRTRMKNHSNRYSEIEIDGLLTGHFLDHPTISCCEFQSLCGFTRSTAYRHLKKLIEAGKLQKMGHPQSPLYEPVKGYYRRG